MTELEKQPDSSGYKQVLAEEIARAKAADDPELKAAAQNLLHLLNEAPGGGYNVRQEVSGHHNIVVGRDANVRNG